VKRKARGNESFANVMRGMARLTSKQSLDSQGRMLIPADLREHAGLDKEIVVVGVFDWVEIWDARRWNESASADAEAAYLEQAAEFFNGGSPDSLEERP
jgi:MraZ protein